MSNLSSEEVETKYEKFFEELVPAIGKCNTVEGETLRAISKVSYRYFNDGDLFHTGYGIETAGPSHAYLTRISPIKADMDKILLDTHNEDKYKECIELAVKAVVEWIESKNGSYEENDVDSLDCEALFEEEEEICYNCGECLDSWTGACGCNEEEEDDEDDY